MIIYVFALVMIGSIAAVVSYYWPRMVEKAWEGDAREMLGINDKEGDRVVVWLSPKDVVVSTRSLFILAMYILVGVPVHVVAESAIELIAYTAVISAALYAAVIDKEHLWIPDECHFVVLSGALALSVVTDMADQFVLNALAGVCVYGFIYAVRLIGLLIKKVEWIGLGDAKLLAVLTLIIGAGSINLLILISSVTALSVYVLRSCLSKNKGLKLFAFGPYIVFAFLIIWYGQLFGFGGLEMFA